MPLFHINFRNGVGTRADDACILFPDLDNAYLHVCATIPDAAQKILLKGEDPLACAFVIADTAGQTLMDVPFSEVLTRRDWRRERAPSRPAESPRSPRARALLARRIFTRSLGDSPIPHALVSLDFELMNMNDAGFALTGEAPERVLGQRVFDTFEGYQGPMSERLEAFYGLAARGLKARVTNLRYDMVGESGPIRFWSQALAWPILDDDGRVLAIVNCAVASPKPWADGKCTVMVGHEAA